jgi:pimeloyl-ACP methyl ester carboxylesterase/predicted Ser/Thr protein kinase
VRRGGASYVVKDWSRRAAWVRASIAPWLARHEAAMLARADGIPGVPRLRARIDRLAFAMEFIEGRPLRRRTHGRALPPRFFAALETILDALASRGVVYLDLRSPTNVLVTPSGDPALVDLGSALRLPLPRAWIRRLEARALAKLRSRFERQAGREPVMADVADDMSANLKVGGTRLCLREHGTLDDPVPVLFLPEAGFSSRYFAPLLESAGAHGRRAIGVDPPGFGGSRPKVTSLAPPFVAEQLEALLDALRIQRVDVVGAGWGARIGAALEARSPARVRRSISLSGAALPTTHDEQTLRAALQASLPRSLSADLRGALEAELARASSLNLARASIEAEVESRVTPVDVGAASRIVIDASCANDPDRFWSDIGTSP